MLFNNTHLSWPDMHFHCRCKDQSWSWAQQRTIWLGARVVCAFVCFVWNSIGFMGRQDRSASCIYPHRIVVVIFHRTHRFCRWFTIAYAHTLFIWHWRIGNHAELRRYGEDRAVPRMARIGDAGRAPRLVDDGRCSRFRVERRLGRVAQRAHK